MVATIKLISSAVGYMSDGFAVAAFIPQALAAAAWREVDLTPGFLAIWVTGGGMNLIGNLISPTQTSQKILGTWYMIVNVVLVVQLFQFGSDHKGSPVKWKGPRNQHIVNSRKGWWREFWVSLERFDVAAVFKLCAFVEVVMLALWGFLTLVPMMNDPDWDIQVPTGRDITVLAIGWCGVLCFFLARLVQIVQGWIDFFMGKEPEPSRVNIIFYLLYLENILQLVSILILDPLNLDYYAYESPWIFGAGAPLLVDLILVGSKKFQIARHGGKREKTEEKDAADEEQIEARLNNLIVIYRQRCRLSKMISANSKPESGASNSDWDAYKRKKQLIEAVKIDLIHSPQRNEEEKWAHTSTSHGPQFGPLDQFLRGVVRPFQQAGERANASLVRQRDALADTAARDFAAPSARSTGFSSSAHTHNLSTDEPEDYYRSHSSYRGQRSSAATARGGPVAPGPSVRSTAQDDDWPLRRTAPAPPTPNSRAHSRRSGAAERSGRSASASGTVVTGGEGWI